MPRKTASRASALLQAICAAVLLCTAAASPAADQSRHILFIGNSLTYVNNLPSAVASLAPADVNVDAFALPGASLVDYDHNPRVAELLAKGHYTDVVFQERGGNVVCVNAACYDGAEFMETERASKSLAGKARTGGARVFYLGTWQANPAVEPALLAGERRVSQLMGASYIEIGQTWTTLRKNDPGGAWLHSDGQHPGHATTALMAIRVWHAISGQRADRHASPARSTITLPARTASLKSTGKPSHPPAWSRRRWQPNFPRSRSPAPGISDVQGLRSMRKAA